MKIYQKSPQGIGDLGKRMHSKKLFVLFILISLIAGIGIGYYGVRTGERKITLRFPPSLGALTTTQFSCDSMVSSWIYGSNNEQQKGVFGSLAKGTDKIAIEVEDDKLYFMTRAAVEIGFAKPEEHWSVVRNSTDSLIAVLNELNNPLRDSVNILMLNKLNGVGVWTKTRSNLFGTDNPDAQSFFLHCH